MNAPFQARAGLRDPFTAFVCDDATADMLRPVAVELGWSPEKVNKGGLRNAVQSLSISASPNILFVDLSESADPLNDINALAEVCEPGTLVIAAGCRASRIQSPARRARGRGGPDPAGTRSTRRRGCRPGLGGERGRAAAGRPGIAIRRTARASATA